MKETKIHVRALLFFTVLLIYSRVAYCDTSWPLLFNFDHIEKGDPLILPTAFFADINQEKIYIVDFGGNRLLSFDRHGVFLNTFTANGALNKPRDMVKKDNATLYIIQQGEKQITLIHLKERKIEKKPVTNGNNQPLVPGKIELFSDTLYLLDGNQGEIHEVDSSFRSIKKFPCAQCEFGFVDFQIQNNRLYALEKGEPSLHVFLKTGEMEQIIKLKDNLIMPVSLAIAPNGFIFIADRKIGNIQVYDSGGTFRYTLLEKGNKPGQLSYPIELRFDPWGRLNVVDEGNGRLEVYGQ